MRDREKRGDAGGLGSRPVVYCLIPPDLAPKLHEPLRRHFRDDPGVEIVVERRDRERRRAKERRRARGESPTGEERRLVRVRAGRRVGERRARLVALAEAPELPRRARRYAERIVFARRLEPSTEEAEDRDTARLVARAQGGDEDAFGALYRRYFDRVYGYLRVLLKDHHDAEDATQQVFAQAFEALPAYERRRQPFRAWLFVVARNVGISQLRKEGRAEPVDPFEIADRAEREPAQDIEDIELTALNWITDPDLMLFVERLPLSQRQVLALRYMLDLSARQTAEVLGRTENEVRMLQHRAQKFLRDRLTAIGRAPKSTQRSKSQTRPRQAIVVRERRYILDP